MRDPGGVRLEFWALLVLLVAFATGCPNSSGTVDAAQDLASPRDAVEDLATVDRGEVDGLSGDVQDDLADAGVGLDAPDEPLAGCIPGMSVACACTDGRTGAQVCSADRMYGPCQCASGMDAGGTADVMLAPLPPRLIAPQSVSRVTSRRPTLRWVLPEGVTRARVELCADRPCTRMLVQQEVTGTSWRPTAMLAPGVTYWRVRRLGADGGVAWASATWEFVVGQRDALVDTSFGTIKDFNGDGYDDVATPRFGTSYAVNLYYGRTSRGSSEPMLQLDAGQNQIVGLNAGDFNGDGFADLAVVLLEAHAVRIYYGSRTGLPREPSLVLSMGGYRHFAWTIAVGDANGDGYSDLVTSSFHMSASSSQVLDFFRGSERGLGSIPSATIEGPDTMPFAEGYGDDFIIVGDVNTDGYADLVTADGMAPEGSRRERGRAWVVEGHPSQPFRTWTSLPPPTGQIHFGATVGGVGDLNGDGAADFAIRSEEEVSVYLGAVGSFRTSPSRTIPNPEGHCDLDTFGFGSGLGSGGDYNGDGYADLAIGAECLPYRGFSRFGEGSTFLYAGHSGGVSVTPLVFRGPASNSAFGGALGGIGDFNGDGLGDLAISQGQPVAGNDGTLVRPTLYIFLGSTRGLSRDEFWPLSGMDSRFYPVVALVPRNLQRRGG